MSQKNQSTALVTDKSKQLATLETFLRERQHTLAKLAPGFMDAARLCRMFIGTVSRAPKLLDCTPQSILLALMDACYYGLEPNPALGHSYIIPYRNNDKGVTEAQFQTGYKGLILLAHRSKAVQDIEAVIIHENDEFRLHRHLQPQFTHVPVFDADPGSVRGVYALAHMPSGYTKFHPLTLKEIDFYRRKSRSRDEGPWVTDFEAMARKTAIRRICATLPLEAGTPLASALAQEAEFEETGHATYSAPAQDQRETLEMPQKPRTEQLAERLEKKRETVRTATSPQEDGPVNEDSLGEPRDR